MSLTVHWLTPSFEQNIVLVVVLFPESHYGSHIAPRIEEVVAKYQNSTSKVHLIIQYNEANLVQGVRETRFGGLTSSLQTLPIVIHNSFLN